MKDLPKMAVLLGANGSGKSTFFDVFGFLRDALKDNVTIALNKRGGFQEVLSRGANPEDDTIRFEVRLLDDRPEEGTLSLITYFLEIGYLNGKAYVERETLKLSQAADQKEYFTLLAFEEGAGYAVTNEEAYATQGAGVEKTLRIMSSSDTLAVKGLGQFKEFKTISALRELLEKWQVFNFKIPIDREGRNTELWEQLSATGDNLAAVTKHMYDYHRDVFDTILQKLPLRIPGINSVEAKETEDGRIILKFKDENFKESFASRYISDGTLKMFAYLILLHDPNPHPLLCIEEPENFLHPDLLLPLCEEIREYADRGGQVFVSTHSPDFVNGLYVDELFFIEKKEGNSVVKAAANDPVVVALAAENKLGWLWRSRFIEGANL